MCGTHPVTTDDPTALGGWLNKVDLDVHYLRLAGKHDKADALNAARARINNAFGKSPEVYVPTRRTADGSFVYINRGF